MMERFRGWYAQSLVVKLVTTIVVVFLTIAVMLPLVLLAEQCGVNVRENTGLNFDPSPGQILFFLLYGAVAIAIIWAAQRWLHRKPLTELGFKPKVLRALGIGFLLGASLMGLRVAFMFAAADHVEVNSILPQVPSVGTYVLYYLYFMIGFLLWNSFIEELTTRAYPIERLKRHLNPHVIFTVMGLIFALGHLVLHPFSVSYVVNLFLSSYLFSLVYHYSGSIWMSTGMHTGLNWMTFTLFGTNWKMGALCTLTFSGIHETLLDGAYIAIKLLMLGGIVWAKRKGWFGEDTTA